MQSLSAILQMVRANALSIVHFREKESEVSEKLFYFRNVLLVRARLLLGVFVIGLSPSVFCSLPRLRD